MKRDPYKHKERFFKWKEKIENKELGDIKSQLSKEQLERQKLQEKVAEMEEMQRLRGENVSKFLEMVENNPTNFKPQKDSEGNTIIVLKTAKLKK